MATGQIAAFHALFTPMGQRLLATLSADDITADPLKAATEARRYAMAHVDGADTVTVTVGAARQEVAVADVVNAALTQARLRGRAHEKFGAAAERMYFTPDGLEQATRNPVARYRAAAFASAVSADPDRPVGDLCCGIGADLVALARAGLVVEGVDADPLTAAVAQANIAAFDLSERAWTRRGDATEVAPERYAAMFCDPARRGKRGRVFDPRAYSPPWETVVELARRAPAACLKAAPGIPHELVPDGAGVEWISARGEVKEAALWFGALARAPRQATVLLPSPGEEGSPERPVEAATLRADPEAPEPAVTPVGRYLYEPDGAVVRAHLVAEAAALVAGSLLDPRIAYLTGDTLVATPFCRAYEVDEVLAFSLKRLRAALRRRHVGNVTIKKRGSAVDVDRLRRDLRLEGPNTAVVILTRIGSHPIAILCSEVSASPPTKTTTATKGSENH